MPRYTTNQAAFPVTTGIGVGVGTSTSVPIDVSQRVKMSIEITAASITSGNGVFSVLVSNDGTNFVTYNRLVTNATKTNAQSDVGVASVTLNATGSQFIFFPIGDYFRYIEVQVVGTTDGTYNATIQSID